YALTHQDNFNWKEAALWTGGGAVVGATFGAGAQFVAGALGTQTTLTTVVTTAGASASSPGGARIIHWLEQNTNRVQHILASKHAWDRLGNLSGNLVQDYRLIQPFIQQTINSGVGRQIDVTPKGPLLEFMATINGQQVVVRVIQLANNAFEISNAWVKTP
ncbi:MAG: polymorphic toxin type 35 domain-containing protein, partial [Anaerolineae bacterium]